MWRVGERGSGAVRGATRGPGGGGGPGVALPPGGGPAGCLVGAAPGLRLRFYPDSGVRACFPVHPGILLFSQLRSGFASGGSLVDVWGSPARSGCLPGPEPDFPRTRHRTGGPLARTPGRTGGPERAARLAQASEGLARRSGRSSSSPPRSGAPVSSRGARVSCAREAALPRAGCLGRAFRRWRHTPAARPGPAQPPTPSVPAADRAGVPGCGPAGRGARGGNSPRQVTALVPLELTTGHGRTHHGGRVGGGWRGGGHRPVPGAPWACGDQEDPALRPVRSASS